MPWPTTSRQSRGYGGEWDRKRRQILKRDKGLCQACLRLDRITIATEVDHIEPKAKGGSDDESNLEATCNPCHRTKTARENGQRVRTVIGDDGWPVQAN